MTNADGTHVRQDSSGPVYGLRTSGSIGPNNTVLDTYRLPASGHADSLYLVLYRPVEGGFEHLAELMLSLK